MNLPNLPTDNLYKFATLASIVFMVTLFISLGKDREFLFDETFRWSEQKINLEALRESKGSESREFRIDSAKFVVEDAYFQQLRSDYNKTHSLYLWITLLFTVVLCVALVMWFTKHQRYQDIIIRNQAEPYRNDKLSHVSKLQAELEIECYKTIWPRLVALNRDARSLDPRFLLNEDVSIKRGKFSKFWENYEEVKLVLENNKPFYAKEVFLLADELFSISTDHSFDYILSESKNVKKIETNLAEITTAIDKISDAISERLGNLSVFKS